MEQAAKDKCGAVSSNAVREVSMNTMSFHHCVFTVGSALSRVCNGKA